MQDNSCIVCGRIIPEGKQVCLSCELSADINKPIVTNGDRIRSMPDDVLADYIFNLLKCDQSGLCTKCPLEGAGDCKRDDIKKFLAGKV